MTISLDQIKQLRQATGVGIGDCKQALQESCGDFEKAKLILREKGKKLTASTASGTEGVIGHYVHHNQQIAVLVELTCQTDFVARNKKGPFQAFARDVAMHVASTNPSYVGREDIPVAEILAEKEFLYEQAKTSGRPQNVIETRIIPGQMEKFFAEKCLLDQPFVKDEKVKVKDALADLAAQVGEVITIKRFVRYKVG